MGRGFESRRDHKIARFKRAIFVISYQSTYSPTTMADNYLEKQYADYEKRRAEWERQKKLGKLPKKKKTNEQ